jgi:hypothetical protein
MRSFFFIKIWVNIRFNFKYIFTIFVHTFDTNHNALLLVRSDHVCQCKAIQYLTFSRLSRCRSIFKCILFWLQRRND